MCSGVVFDWLDERVPVDTIVLSSSAFSAGIVNNSLSRG